MARKIDDPTAPTAPDAAEVAASAQAVEELAILHPDRPLPIGGRHVTVREYGHYEGLRLLAWAKPFLDDLYAAWPVSGAPAPSPSTWLDLQVKHARLMRDMAAQSVTPFDDNDAAFDRARQETAKWVAHLNDDDGDLLLLMWWEVNRHFFTRRLLRRAAGEKLAERLQAGVASTTTSSEPATAAPPPTSDG